MNYTHFNGNQMLFDVRIKYKSDMKRMVMTTFFCGFFISFAFSQNVYQVREGTFLKRVEHNLILLEADYNLKSKGDIEKLFFGDFNASVEFFMTSDKGYAGFRILRDSLKTSDVLEIKYISNFEEVQRMNPPEEQLKFYYKVESWFFPIGIQFSEKLYERMVSLIDNFKTKGLPVISVGGISATFRTVVDNEVWSLWIINPQGKDTRKMADLCRQIIKDSIDNEFDESKYMTVLKTFEK